MNGYGLWSLRNECWLRYEDLCRYYGVCDAPCVFRTAAEAQQFLETFGPDWDGNLAEARDERGGFVVKPME